MLIPRHAYTDERVFEQELTHLFAQRFFVGTEQDFTEGDSYRSFQLGRRALTCRRDGEAVRVFNNVCLHRNALIDPPGQGCRAFRCRYHGWRYNASGEVSHTPFADASRLAHQCLPQFPVTTAAGLHFVGLNGTPPEVGEVACLAERLGWQANEAPFATGSLLHHCNWKLLVENVLEAYHVGFVHENSFGASGVSVADFDATGAGDYTTWEFVRPEAPKVASLISKLPGASFQHLHGYVFPNLFLINNNNLVGYLGQVLPVSANQTLLHWQLYALPALQQLPRGVRDKICADADAMNRTVLQEDKPMLEACQQGLASEGQAYQLQSQEKQLQHFHAMWQGYCQK